MRERVAPTGVLARHAARQDVILLPDAVDEDVDGGGVLGAGTQACVAVAVLGERHARHRVRERQEVAGTLRQGFDLLLRNVGRHLGRARFGHELGNGLDAFKRGNAIRGHRRLPQVHRGDLANRECDGARTTGPAFHAIGAGRQARDVVAAVCIHRRAAAEAGFDIGHGDRGTRRGLAAQRGCGRLRHRRCGHGKARDQRAAKQIAVEACACSIRVLHGIPSRETFVLYEVGRAVA